MSAYTVGAALLLASVALSAPGMATADFQESDLIALADFPREQLVVETPSARRHEFDAWRADTPETHEQGLMFVHEMRDDQAMIFVYDPPANVAMWMKNTFIPLDMLFVNRDGCVVKVKRDARPQSLATISAGMPIALVVELKGGLTSALGIEVGDRVSRPAAHWPAVHRNCSTAR